MKTPAHHRAFSVTVAWTLALLFLGSVVHATGSSLACPDWPTCFGSLTPRMVGGVFWEHLHRLVAGGLVLWFSLTTWLAWRGVPPGRRWVVKTSLAGIGLLLVQAVFGGLTVLWRLPDWVSTTHLGLALAFLALAVVLASATSPERVTRETLAPEIRHFLRVAGGATAGLVFLQSLLGGYVRHSDAGMACGRGILCNGGLVPPAFNHAVGVQYLHRLLGLTVALVVLWLAVALGRRTGDRSLRVLAWTAAGLVVGQVVLGFLGVRTVLGVVPISLHTLVAAGVLAVLVALATRGWLEPAASGAPAATEVAAAGAG